MAARGAAEEEARLPIGDRGGRRGGGCAEVAASEGGGTFEQEEQYPGGSWKGHDQRVDRDEEPLIGNVTAGVVRVGATVSRPVGAWTDWSMRCWSRWSGHGEVGVGRVVLGRIPTGWPRCR